ncbi:MAG TPA: hypothetical protein VFO65_06455 [Acidimicrobiales bacterium]|nr:hypothetical protein [Acidimicrobiales bacterium]
MTSGTGARLPRLGLGLATGGAAAQVAGLAIDARLHGADPGLAARESVFTLSNAGHVLLLAGLVAVAGGVALLLAGGRAAPAPGGIARPRPTGLRRLAPPLAVAAAAVLSVTTAASAARVGDGPDHHDGAGDHRAADHDAGPAPAGGPGAGPGGHGHEPPIPVLDDAAAGRLDAQLASAREVAARYPTVAEAMAGGFAPATPYDTRIGSHYLRFADVDAAFDVGRPEMLLYDGDDPTSAVVGLSYYVVGSTPPEGFEGEADVWHRHVDTCLTPEGPVFAGDGYRRCPASGRHGWMLHAWVVPGWESPEGVFSAGNARLS